MSWTIHTSWRAYRTIPAAETSETRPDWQTARGDALRLCCLAGVRYVTVHGPGDVVVADYDRYTNRWREYPRSLAALGAVAGAAPVVAAHDDTRHHTHTRPDTEEV